MAIKFYIAKAFDTLDYQFLLLTLNVYGFNETFLGGLKLSWNLLGFIYLLMALHIDFSIVGGVLSKVILHHLYYLSWRNILLAEPF